MCTVLSVCVCVCVGLGAGACSPHELHLCTYSPASLRGRVPVRAGTNLTVRKTVPLDAKEPLLRNINIPTHQRSEIVHF